MMSLESEVSGASLSPSATIQNKNQHYNCVNVETRAFKLPKQTKSIVHKRIVTALTPLLFPLLFIPWHLIPRSEILRKRNEIWAYSSATEQPWNTSLWNLLLPVSWHCWRNFSRIAREATVWRKLPLRAWNTTSLCQNWAVGRCWVSSTTAQQLRSWRSSRAILPCWRRRGCGRALLGRRLLWFYTRWAFLFDWGRLTQKTQIKK